MEFFNKKEEVIDFKLTEYGKNLLAQGKLKPAYYAFLTMMCYMTSVGLASRRLKTMHEGASKAPHLK